MLANYICIMSKLKKNFLVALLLLFPSVLFAQKKAYFIDGFHGGIWGHYPVGYTSYVVSQLNKYPNWNINLEIEPETWQRDLKVDLEGFNALKTFMSDTSVNSRVEYVNPAYGQPYMFNISGESIIRQFAYGMQSLRTYFPSLSFKTYSSEEPCFTSALPQILKSFGFKYASLKNPNTCWGGYTRAHGKELVNWIGPDGTSILTSPRYEIELLKPNSTWETIGNGNSKEFIGKALADGIENPVGMCLQDAGWRFGPWLKGDFYQPTSYTTWRNYFENIAKDVKPSDWKFAQEDVQTSLVWGSQVMQRLSQQVRKAENKIVRAEKIATMQKLENQTSYPSQSIDDAWRNLMLAQHHDCWIVPYNGKKGDTWADKVKTWTTRTTQVADSIGGQLLPIKAAKNGLYIKVYNTLARTRNEWLKAALPEDFYSLTSLVVTDENNVKLPVQLLKSEKALLFKGTVPALGYAVFHINKGVQSKTKGANVTFNSNGDCILETDQYKIYIDKAKGGTIKSLIAKTLDGKEFVDAGSERKFNELRGNFYKLGGFKTNTSEPAQIAVLENGPYLIKVNIVSQIAGHPVTQTLTLKQGEPLIDCDLTIDWKGSQGIGEFEETNYQATALHKAFYNDRYKLLTLFPLALKNQKVFKDAPYDVTESKLDNTFFSTWDSIKNNMIFNWVDVVDGHQKYGMAMFSDHVTSYAHGTNFPLGLTTQYAGKGLWGRDYVIDQSTKLNYKLLPHKGNWQHAGLSHQNEMVKEPLQLVTLAVKPKSLSKSFIESSSDALEISSCTYQGDNLYVRIFNAANTPTKGKLKLDFDLTNADFVNLDGSEISGAILNGKDEKFVDIRLKPFGIATLKISQK